MKGPTFGQYYSTKNILLQFWWKALLLVNPSVLEIFCCSFGEKPYFWSILCTSFGKSYSTRNILPRLVHPRKCWWQYRAISTTFESLTPTERLSTVSSPFLSIFNYMIINNWYQFHINFQLPSALIFATPSSTSGVFLSLMQAQIISPITIGNRT